MTPCACGKSQPDIRYGSSGSVGSYTTSILPMPTPWSSPLATMAFSADGRCSVTDLDPASTCMDEHAHYRDVAGFRQDPGDEIEPSRCNAPPTNDDGGAH